MPTVLFIDSVHPILEERLTSLGYSCVHDYKSSQEEIIAKADGIEGFVIRSRFTLERKFLSAFPKLKWVARSGSGLENIDLDGAKELGVLVFNSPEGNRDAVAEHAVGMLLMLFNKLQHADREVRQKAWNREANRGLEICGKTVGIIGCGVMGLAFAQRLSGFGCAILAYDKYKSNHTPDYIQEVEVEKIYATADIVSMHTTLTDETRHLVNDAFFEQYAKPIFLINTSRGPVVETAALVRALKSGKVLGACLDVLEYEETSFEKINLHHDDFEYLAQNENVILTPHVAGWTKESYVKLSSVLADKIEEWKNTL